MNHSNNTAAPVLGPLFALLNVKRGLFWYQTKTRTALSLAHHTIGTANTMKHIGTRITLLTLTGSLVYGLLATSAAAEPTQQLLPSDGQLQLAAVQTRRTVKRLTPEAEQPKPYNQVPVSVSMPSTSVANKPFIVIYRFSSPVTGFSSNLVRVDRGRVTYFAGNQARTVYRLLVLPNQDLHKSDNPFTSVLFSSQSSGDLSRKVRIVEAPKGGSGGNASLVSLDPSILGHITYGIGGDNVTGSDQQIGRTYGFQVGFTYPLPRFNSVVNEILPSGSVRVHLGYDEGTAGSTSRNTRYKFSYANADILYEIVLSNDFKFVAGVAIAFQPKLEAQDLELRNVNELQDAKVDFKTAYGLKIFAEYAPLGYSYKGINPYIDFGFVIIDFIPEKITLNKTSRLSTAGTNVLSSPTRVGGSAFKIGVGARY